MTPCECCTGEASLKTRGGRRLCSACRDRRERIATAVLAGLMADASWRRMDHGAAAALAYADALMAALDKPEEK